MLVLFGFLLAALIVLVVLPAYRRRVERFATGEIRRTLPLTEAEMRADKDRLRAEFALKLHRLEMKLEEASYAAARQTIEINRREAKISDLDQAFQVQASRLEEHENARRVLEQAVADRLPKVEQRLAETRRLLSARDAELAGLAKSSLMQTAALEEATQINVQQASEVERLKTALEARSTRHQEARSEGRVEAEAALKSELEALRAKAREQTALIDRLQKDLKDLANKSVTALPVALPPMAHQERGTKSAAESALEAEIAGLRQSEQAARAEIKSLTEKLARQAKKFESDLRLAALAAQSGADIAHTQSLSLSERIVQPRAPKVSEPDEGAAAGEQRTGLMVPGAVLRNLNGSNGNGAAVPHTPAASAANDVAPVREGPKRGRLLERIGNIDKPS